MRIPTSTTDGLYPAPGNRSRVRRNQTDPWRRLIRMMVVLALVIVVMQQASNPAYFAPLFPGQTTQLAATKIASGSMSRDFLARPIITDDIRERADELLAMAGKTEWPVIWNFLSYGGRSTDSEAATVPSALAGLADRSEEEQSAMRAVLLQKLLLNRVLASRDGTVWRSDDLPAIEAALRLHQQPPHSAAIEDWQTHYANASPTGVIALLQQPETHRGHRFIASGELIRLEHVTHSDDAYWHLWLKPSDGSNRPWLTVVDTLPKPVADWFESATTSDVTDASETPLADQQQVTGKDVPAPYPVIHVTGVFIKRLSFRSQLGAELTPVVVGRIASTSPQGIAGTSVTSRNKAPSIASSSLSLRFIALFAGCVLISISVATWVMWRSAAEHRALRKRRKHQKIDFS